jgi:hypothetical protein
VQASVQQHAEEMSVEGGCQGVPFRVGNTGRLPYTMLPAKQCENLRQPASSCAKLTLLPPSATGSVTSQDGFVCLGETQPVLAQPSAKPVGQAHVPPALLVVEGIGNRRQARRTEAHTKIILSSSPQAARPVRVRRLNSP